MKMMVYVLKDIINVYSFVKKVMNDYIFVSVK